jgi:TolB protein
MDLKNGLATLPDGRIVYDVDAKNIMIVDAGVGNPKQLTTNAQGRANTGPAASPDGGLIVYGSATDCYHLWRMDSDGGNARQLTFGGGEIDPQISPDGKWIVYSTMDGEKPTIWRIPFEGGAATQLTYKTSVRPRISPDGKMIVCGYWDEWPNKTPKIALIPFSGKGAVKTLSLDHRSLQSIRWTPDGKALTYIEDRAGVSNLWSLPLDGGAPRQLTDFKSDRIYNYVWSRDGGQIICARGVDVSDAVLISGFR